MFISFKDSQEANKKVYKDYPEGKYQVKVINVSEGNSKNGTPYLEVEFETMGELVFKVRKRFYQTPKALSVLLNFLSAVGIYDSSSNEDLNFDNNDLLGAILKVELVKGEANEQGKQFLELKAWSCEAVGGLTTKKEETLDNSDTIPF